jgi:S-DNA-T family DNA segregation ATPase FtsK/SpoIIIE
MTDTITETPVGTLHHLDDHRPPAVPVQLVKDPAPEQETTPAAPAAPTLARTRHALRVARIIATHDRTATAARMVARHSLYTAGGAHVLARRAWDGRTAARYERMMRTAEAAGKPEAVTEWEERGRQFRAARHQRRMDLLAAPQRIAKAAAVGTAATGAGLLGLGTILAIAESNPALILAPVMVTIQAIRWAVVIITIIWGPALWLAPWMAFLGLWNTGRRQQTAPAWALPAGQRGTDGEPITPSIVVTAMRDLGIGPLKTAIKGMEDNGASMLSPIVLAGCGVEVEVLLPTGVSTEEVMNRRRKLAENLGRHEHEVFVTKAQAARTVNLWIADSGALDEPIGPSPLALDADTSADYKAGRAPWGVDLRGDAAMLSVFQCHFLITGLSNQGKTASLRAMALWLGHDVTVEFRVGDLKGIGDWSCMTGIATTLIEGPTDEHVIAVTLMVEDAVAEMMWRLQQPKGTKFNPLIVIVDEAQVAYGSGAIGKDKRPYGGSKATSRYFQGIKSIHDQGRAVSVTTWEGTQDPTNENLPKRSREGNHIRAALVLGTEEQAKMALGAKAIDGGAAPHKLRQGLDKGVVVVAGDGVKLAPGQSSLTIRTHYIDDTAADEIADRIRARRAAAKAGPATEPTEELDPLADIAAVIGDAPRMRTDEVRQGLAARNPAAYREWTASDLTRVLEAVDAAPRKSNGVMVVSSARVQEALNERDEAASEAVAK